MGRRLREIAAETGARIVFKSSYDKANRSSKDSFRGPGLDEGLAILAAVKTETGLPVISDVHEPAQAERAARVLDVLQIPAFLSRQTDLILAAAATGKPVHVKKGQFLAPDDMEKVVEKCRSVGNEKVLLCERGSSFGYHDLVVDMRGFAMMRALGCPVVYDTTHSLQLPGSGRETGGLKQYAPALARAAAATARTRSVWRERKAGTWSTSRTLAAFEACAGSCTSEMTGSPVFALTAARMSRPSSSPGPRNESFEERLALSYDDL